MTIRITDMAKGASFMKIIFLKYRALTSQFLLRNFPAGEYKLEITGTPSGHLTGYFTQE